MIKKSSTTEANSNKNDILIFRTSITTEQEIEKIKKIFAQHSQIHKWNVDFEDCEKILRIESNGIMASGIMNMLQTIDIYISELE